MQGSFEEPPIIVKARPARGALACAGSALMDALLVAAVLVAGVKADVALVFYFAFFAVGCAAGLWMLMAPAKLTASPEGLTERVLWRTRRYGWGEVYDFQPAAIGLMATTVGFNFTDERPRSFVRWLSKGVSGVQEQLNVGWEIEPAALASLLNAARSRWLDGLPEPEPRPAGAVADHGFAGARMDRRTFAALAILTATAALALCVIPRLGVSAWIVAALFFVRYYAARLHDLGRSGWWQLTLYGLQAAVLTLAATGKLPADAGLEIGAGLQIAFTAALALAPGRPGANRFGPEPGRLSPLAVAEPFR